MGIWTNQQSVTSQPQRKQTRDLYSNPQNQPQTQTQNNGLAPSPQTVNRYSPQQNQQNTTPIGGGGGFAGYNSNGVSQTNSRNGYGLGGNYNPGLSGSRLARPRPIAPTVAPTPTVTTPAPVAAQQPPPEVAPRFGGGGSMVGGAGFDNYGDFNDAVGHEGVAKGGLNREQYRDAWMSSGISNPQQMDAFLAQHGGQRLNDSGVVRTPFGEVLDMGINYKTGRGQPGWTNIGMNG